MTAHTSFSRGRARLLAATIATALTAGLVPAATSAAADTPVFQVGAAVGDMTPPAFNPAGHTPSTDPPGLEGPRAWDFTEPYADQDGSGFWDAGEPYADLNHNLRYDGIYLGGGGRDDLPPTKVADPITARAFVVDNGSKRIAVEVLDVIGMFNNDMDLVRKQVAAQLGPQARDEIFISSTHDESAPDVIGLWGPGLTPAGSGIANAGVNDYWMSFAIQRAAQAIVDAYHAREAATIRFAETTQPDDFLTCWSSYPYVRASKVPVLQAVSTATGRAIVTMFNYGIHAETLAFNGGDVTPQKYWLSADWPYWARAALEERYGGVAIQMAGAVGSVETPKIFPTGSVSPVPTGRYDAGHPAGCRTIFSTSGDPLPLGYDDETRAIGEGIAGRVAQALDSSASPATSSVIRFARAKFYVPLTNMLFAGAGIGQTFPRRPLYVNGAGAPEPSMLASDPAGSLTGTATPEPNTGGLEVKTEVVVYQIGDAEFVSTPGEQFPIGFVRGFQGPQDMPYPSDAMTDWVTPHMTGHFRFIEGLGEDMIGYLFPKANAVGVPGERTESAANGFDDTDRFGCGHSDDSEAASGEAGNIVATQAIQLLDGLDRGTDRILTGRYEWPDGTLHRNPLGDGTLGCTDATNGFAPAPGPAIGVVVQQDGLPVTYTIAGPGHDDGQAAVAFIDYNGNPQGTTPTVDTRGVLLPDGTRIYVDVYPD
jgi:hypothetical protein